EFWSVFVRDFSATYIRNHSPQEIEHKVLLGIPADMCFAIYSSMLNIPATVESHTYESLVRKAKLAKFEGGTKPDSDPADRIELSEVYWYCLKGNVHVASQVTGLLSPALIENFARILQLAEGISKHDALAILFKITERLATISKAGFKYKGSRCLEDFASEQFLHVTKQGINILAFFDTAFERFTEESMEKNILLNLFNMVLLEGPDYLLRLLCSAFERQKDRVLSLDGDALKEYIFSEEFFSAIDSETLEKSLNVDFPIIKYENEYSFMNSNSISGNDNEISNLQEANQELTLKLEGLKEKFVQLQITHEEIFGQNSEYASKLAHAREEKASLLIRKANLQQKYNQLTMQDNLSNTIKANKDISMENQNLEQQIEVMKKKVEAK
ncbi:hypothetical protein METBIDRAFT_20990, partial [Metschnikowia bicuspidata var. bicuspidata NRRL YB-4993]